MLFGNSVIYKSLDVMLSRFNVSIWKFFSVVTGALSVLDLIQSLTAVELLGQLSLWIRAYTRVIDSLFGYLFGWISFNWISISGLEHHAIVIGLLLTSAYFRAQVRYDMDHGESWFSAASSSFMTSIFLFLVVFVPALLLPAQYGFWGSMLGIIILSFRYFTPSQWSGMASGREVWNQLITVAGVCIAVLLINNMMFA